MSKYRNVVFIGNGDQAEFDRWYVDWDDSKEDGFAYLLQWEYGEPGEISDTPPWGHSDTVEYFSVDRISYAVSYNWHLSYVSLTEVIG